MSILINYMLFIKNGVYFITKSKDISIPLLLDKINKNNYKSKYVLGKITYNINKLGCSYNPNVMKKFKR